MNTSRSLARLLGCLVLVSNLMAASGSDAERWGTPGAPDNLKAVAGNYYEGDGTGHNIYLNLSTDGKYTAEWQGCFGAYGVASGAWRLSDQQITLVPAKEEGMIKGHLKVLDVFKFKGQWIFVRLEDRASYDKHGVARYWCLQRQEKD